MADVMAAYRASVKPFLCGRTDRLRTVEDKELVFECDRAKNHDGMHHAGNVSGVDIRWAASIEEAERKRAQPAPDALRVAVIHAARDVDGLWFPQDDNWTGTDLTFWGPEAGEALRDLRTAVSALDDAEADLPIRTITTPDGQVYRAHVPCCWCGEHHEEGK